MDAERTPVVIATGQAVERDGVVAPLDLAERAAALSLDAAGDGSRDRIERVSVVNMLSPAGRSPASTLAARLGLRRAARCETTAVGGNTPQWLVTRAARDIAAGRLTGAALVVGAETMRSARSQVTPPASPAASDGRTPDPVIGDDRPGIGPAETAIGLVAPAHVYPLFESVLAARAGRSFAEQRAFLGRLLAPFTEVAAKHAYAWFTEPRTPDEISEPSPSNRLVTEPYTKLMNAFLGGDQAAAVVVTSLAVARQLGVADDAVFVWSGADANDVWLPSARADLGASPGIAAAARAALDAAGVTVDDIAAFDVYSCFPSAVQMGAAALGLALDDGRGLTVTGGLPYFGGPGNNYTTHAIATMVERLRTAPAGALGLVTGLGWYVTKHGVGVYGSAPPPRGFVAADTTAAQRAIDASALDVAAGEVIDGGATVDASTVVYGPGGDIHAAPLIATMDDGRRVVAAAADAAESAGGENLVGRRVYVTGWPPIYRVV